MRSLTAFIELNQLELVWESPSEMELVSSVLVVGSDLLSNQSLVIFINCNPLDQPVNLRAFSIEIDLALLVEHSLFSVWAKIKELVLVYKQLWRPRWGHV